ncbi:MAG TPA: ABC transporter substrate-binding protein [Acidimicrobiia bacterium]|nr:ABC transporter substrate-binding protein [Acidimicrobiia bacterium]
MPNQFLRSLGASIIVLALVVAGVIQVANRDPEAAVEITETADSAPAPAPGPTGSNLVAVTQAVEPLVYKVGLLGAPTTFNFWAFYGLPPTVWDSYVLSATKGSLYRLDSESLTLVPDLAHEVIAPTWDENGWKVTVPLRPGSRWSNGQELTADDVAFTFDTVRRLSLGGQWATAFPDEVISVTAADHRTIEVRFAGRPSLDVWPFGLGTAPIMSAAYWETPAGAAQDASELFALGADGDPASGPLEVLEWDESTVVSRSNPGYHGRQGQIVEYGVYSSTAEALSALATGKIHTMLSPRGLTVEESQLLDGVDGVTTIASPMFGIRYLAFNMDRSPMNSVEFRRTVALMLDRTELASRVAGSEPARTLLPPTNSTWNDSEKAEAIGEPAADLSIGLAAQIAALEEIGYSWTTRPSIVDGSLVGGSGLTLSGQTAAPLTILTSGDSFDPARASYAEEVASVVRLLGFEVTTVTTDFDTVIDLTFTRGESGALQYDMALLGWSLGNPGLPSFYGDLLGSESETNNTGYSSTRMDDLIRRYENAHDVATAQSLLWEIEALQASDLAYLPLYSSQIVEAYRSDVLTFGSLPGLGGIQGSLGAFHLISPAR